MVYWAVEIVMISDLAVVTALASSSSFYSSSAVDTTVVVLAADQTAAVAASSICLSDKGSPSGSLLSYILSVIAKPFPL